MEESKLFGGVGVGENSVKIACFHDFLVENRLFFLCLFVFFFFACSLCVFSICKNLEDALTL